MTHFAQITNGIVERVIVADNASWCEANLGGTWVETSYNTQANQHPEGKPLHKNYAGIGYTWDGIGFAIPKPYNSWILDTETYLWNSPTPMPTDDKPYQWDEEKLAWVEVPTL